MTSWAVCVCVCVCGFGAWGNSLGYQYVNLNACENVFVNIWVYVWMTIWMFVWIFECLCLRPFQCFCFCHSACMDICWPEVIGVATYRQEEENASSCFDWPMNSLRPGFFHFLPLHLEVTMDFPPLEIESGYAPARDIWHKCKVYVSLMSK